MATDNIEFWGNTKVDSQYFDWNKLSTVLTKGCLYINGFQVSPKGFTESERVAIDKVAESKLVVLENFKANVISQLTYLNYDVELACFRILQDGSKVVQVLKYVDGQGLSITLSKGETLDTSIDNTPLDPIEKEKILARLEAECQQKQKVDPKFQELNQEFEEELKFSEVESKSDSTEVGETFLSEPIFDSPHDKNEKDYYDRFQDFELKISEALNRSSNNTQIQIPSQMPRHAWDNQIVPLNIYYGDPINWRPNPTGRQMASMDLYLQVGLYALNNPDQQGKYLVITLQGGGVTPSNDNTLEANAGHARKWIQVGFEIEYSIRYLYGSNAPAIRREKAVPENVNQLRQVTATTGWSITVGGSVDSGPNLGYTYSNERTETMDVRDIEIINKSNPTMAKWEYRLNGFQNCTFAEFEHLIPDKGDYRKNVLSSCYRSGPRSYYRPTWASSPGGYLQDHIYLDASQWMTLSSQLEWHEWYGHIKEIPDLGKYLMVPRNQSIWRTGLDFNQTVEFSFQAQQKLMGLERPEPQTYGRRSLAKCQPRFATSMGSFIVDFSRVRV